MKMLKWNRFYLHQNRSSINYHLKVVFKIKLFFKYMKWQWMSRLFNLQLTHVMKMRMPIKNISFAYGVIHLTKSASKNDKMIHKSKTHCRVCSPLIRLISEQKVPININNSRIIIYLNEEWLWSLNCRTSIHSIWTFNEQMRWIKRLIRFQTYQNIEFNSHSEYKFTCDLDGVWYLLWPAYLWPDDPFVQ